MKLLQQQTLLGVKIDEKLDFEEYISNLFQKASNQLIALNRSKVYIGKKEIEVN